MTKNLIHLFILMVLTIHMHTVLADILDMLMELMVMVILVTATMDSQDMLVLIHILQDIQLSQPTTQVI